MTNIQDKQTYASELSFGIFANIRHKKIKHKKNQLYKIMVANGYSAPAENT